MNAANNGKGIGAVITIAISRQPPGRLSSILPRLKGVTFETAIIERYRRRESSVEEALMEMYLAGVSVRRVEDITEALWGAARFLPQRSAN